MALSKSQSDNQSPLGVHLHDRAGRMGNGVCVHGRQRVRKKKPYMTNADLVERSRNKLRLGWYETSHR